MLPRALQLMLLLLLVIGEADATTSGVRMSSSFGGPHGTKFSDKVSVVSNQTVSSISIRAGERIDGLTLKIMAPKEMTFSHGGTGGNEKTRTFGAGEYVTSMEAHWGKKRGHTRIFYLNFRTNMDNSISAGTQTDDRGTVKAPKGYQLGGFFGRDGDEIDLLGVIWTSIEATSEDLGTATPGTIASSQSHASTTTTTSFEGDIRFSKVFGGPYGITFSDIKFVQLGQKLSSITIRGDKRIDAVTVQVATPTEATWTHGGSGGTDNTLTLGSGEYITSMEIHWAKKSRHTRVFYLKFGTSEGNSISVGTTTANKATATAPKGFQLSGFFGRAAGEVDQLGIIWTRRNAKPALLTDEMGSDWYGITIRNWVGPTIGDASDSACYRKTLPFNSKGACSLGYSIDDDNCITQCPLSYPVECLTECIPQNDGCTLEIAQKFASVAAAAFNVVTAGVFSTIWKTYKTAKQVYMCAATIISVIKSLIYYMRFQQTTAPQGNVEELLAAAYQTDVVLVDLPVAVCTCLGLPVPIGVIYASVVTMVVENIVKQAIINGEQIVSSAKNVIDLLLDTGAINASDTSVTELQDFIDSNTSCGYELKRLADRVIFSVNNIRNTTPDATIDDVRVTMSESSLIVNDVPTVTNNCMKEMLTTKTYEAAFQTRDLLRKTFGVIVDQLVETATTDMGESVAKDASRMEATNMGLVVLGGLDPTGITWMVSQFVQPTCGPTAFIGEIDDGTLFDALGLTTVDEAFEGSYGWWTKKGDGVVNLIFNSSDWKDVTVVIHSGGDTLEEVDVAAGESEVWESTVEKLQDKSLYLDRWRPNAIGIPGSGGGSLVLWVPRSSEGGHITLYVRINCS